MGVSDRDVSAWEEAPALPECGGAWSHVAPAAEVEAQRARIAQQLCRVVAALYVDPRGPYPRMQGVEAWDEARDATTYAGPHPVVAHPPCGPWGALRKMCSRQRRDLAPLAVEQVRQWGGVLEHPRGSLLWQECGLPSAGTVDAFGGFTLDIEQVAWGHKARKATWLYFVGVDPIIAKGGVRRGGTPTHLVSQTRGRNLAGLKRMSDQARKITPPAFAEWLVSLARTVQK